MMDNECILKVNSFINDMETMQSSQDLVNDMYHDICSTIKCEMHKALESRTVKVPPSCKRQAKPWWTDRLSLRWKEVSAAEKAWVKAKARCQKDTKKALYKQKKKEMDREIQQAKRNYWKKEQNELMKVINQDQQLFWKKIGKLGVANDRLNAIPREIILEDGTICSQQDEVMNAWENHFDKMLNPLQTLAPPHTIEFYNNLEHLPSEETHKSLNDQITLQEVFAAIHNAKRGKACGIDEIPVEVLGSLCVQQFLTKLFNVCFENGIVPQEWNNGILQPIVKDRSQDMRSPDNYRGLTLAPHICKLYSKIISSRLTYWVKDNNILNDEQNGFLKNRSCQDQLQTFHSIVETRRLQGLNTYTTFVDFSKAYDRVPRTHMWYKLSRIGLKGNILNALQAMYSNVKCSVRINNDLGNAFKVGCGLKQGCVASPLLFNLYINDLVTEINALDKGIKINNTKVSMLLYADDIVLMSNCARDLQNMLHTLHTWCERWGLCINPTKTKVLHFRPKSHKITSFEFKCGNKVLETVHKYKYLGLWFTDNLDMKYMAQQVAASAQRALGLLIAKSKAVGGFPYDCYTKLYNSLVQSVIDYGACIWGLTDFPCIQAVQNRAIRSFLGVHSKTSTAAIQGEMGWIPQSVSQWLCITRQWCRYSHMDINRLNLNVFLWAQGSRCHNFTHKSGQKFVDLGLEHVMNVNTPACTKAILGEVKEKLLDKFIDEWYGELNKVGAKRGVGLNKLRTYRMFKHNFVTEKYLMASGISICERRAFAQIRCSATAIRIETGRYNHGHYIPVNERVCEFCMDGIEDEIHVLMKCNLYHDLQHELFYYAEEYNPLFSSLSESEKFVYLMSSSDIMKYTAKTCNLILKRRRIFLVSK